MGPHACSRFLGKGGTFLDVCLGKISRESLVRGDFESNICTCMCLHEIVRM